MSSVRLAAAKVAEISADFTSALKSDEDQRYVCGPWFTDKSFTVSLIGSCRAGHSIHPPIHLPLLAGGLPPLLATGVS